MKRSKLRNFGSDTLDHTRLWGSLGHDPRSNGVGGRACRCERLQTGGVNDTRTIAPVHCPPVWTHVWHGGQVFRFKRGARRFRVHLLTREDDGRRPILSLAGMLDNASLRINTDTFYEARYRIARSWKISSGSHICIFGGKLSRKFYRYENEYLERFWIKKFKGRW